MRLNINRIHPGQPARATLDAYPGWKIPAHVIAIIPTADRNKTTVKVQIARSRKTGGFCLIWVSRFPFSKKQRGHARRCWPWERMDIRRGTRAQLRDG
jgi:hypothetical protein